MAENNYIVEGVLVMKDAASAVIKKVSDVADRLKHNLEGGFELMSAVGGLAGVFGLHRTVEDLNNMYLAVGRVKAVTGTTAEEAHGVLNVLDDWGGGLEGAERMLLRMQGKFDGVEDAAGGANQQIKEMTSWFKKHDIDMKWGPEKKLERLAALAKSGDLNVDIMKRYFGMRPEAAAKAMQGLQRGAESFKDAFETTTKSPGVITESALASFERMRIAKDDMADAWGLLANTIYKSIFPVVTSLMNYVRNHLDKWAVGAQRFGTWLNKHLDTAHRTVVAMVKLMALNKGLNMLGFAGGPGTKLLGMAIMPTIGKALQMVAENIDGWGTRLGKLWNQLVVAFETIFGAVKTVLDPVLTMLGLDMKSAASFMLSVANQIGEGWLWIVAVLKGTYEWLVNKMASVFEDVGDFFGGTAEQNAVIDKAFKGGGNPLDIMSQMFDPNSDFAKAGQAADKRKERERSGQGFYDTLDNAHTALVREGSGRYWDNFLKNTQRAQEEATANAMSRSKTPGDRSQNYQDFRGSKFDIKQNFAEGFDSDRIAVAFSRDISNLGERALQSGFAPVNTVR